MNLFRPQKPYCFHPPNYSPWLAPILHAISKRFFLHGKFKISELDCVGGERLQQLHQSGHSLLIAPNHADHADPHVLIHAGKRHRLPLHFMAARECFEKNQLTAFLLKRSGAFSVDREGTDISAIKTAIQVLQQGKHPLVIFPEGEIYHHHETLDPLNEGVATIFLRAADKLPAQRSLYLVPTAMRYTCASSVTDTFGKRLDALEQRITWKPRPELNVIERIYRLGAGLIAIKEIEFLGQAQQGTLPARIESLRNRLVETLETKHRGTPQSGTIPERVKALRQQIRKELTGNNPSLTAKQREALYDDLDTLFVAVQLYSYPGQYLKEEASIHRVAETLLKLEEDVLGEGCYAGPRKVTVVFDEPVEARDFLATRNITSKQAVAALTSHMTDRIQSILEGLRKLDNAPSSEPVRALNS